jgi:hypothetical protein
MFAFGATRAHQNCYHEESGRNNYLEKAHDIPYVIFKAEINHSVGLVHAEVLATVEVYFPLLQHID